MCMLSLEDLFLEESQDCDLYPGCCCPSSQTATSSITAQPKEEATSAPTTKSPTSRGNMLLEFVTPCVSVKVLCFITLTLSVAKLKKETIIPTMFVHFIHADGSK